jgi:hypothetical protein
MSQRFGPLELPAYDSGARRPRALLLSQGGFGAGRGAGTIAFLRDERRLSAICSSALRMYRYKVVSLKGLSPSPPNQGEPGSFSLSVTFSHMPELGAVEPERHQVVYAHLDLCFRGLHDLTRRHPGNRGVFRFIAEKPVNARFEEHPGITDASRDRWSGVTTTPSIACAPGYSMVQT